MDEFDTDGHSGAGEHGAQPAADFHETAGTSDFPVDYEHTGHRGVDDALDRLDRLPGTPLPGHADVYDAVHNDLRAILSEPSAGGRGPQ